MFKIDKTYTEILRISLPISLALIIPFLNLTINNYFLGQMGEMELGTAGITGVYYLLIAMLGNGLHSAIQSIIARRVGEDRKEDIGKTFSQGLMISQLFCILFILFTIYITPIFFKLFIRDQTVYALSINFINIRVWGLPFLYLFQLCNAFFMGTTNTQFLMFGTLAQAGSNILMDYLMIFGNMGFPALGFEGAAWASVVSEIIGFIFIYIVLFRKRFHVRFTLFDHFRIDFSTLKLILRTAVPLMAQYAISLLSWLIFYMLIEHQGERSLAISNLMRNLFAFTGIFIWALASTTNTMVSQMIGQRNYGGVIELVHKIMRLSLLFSISLFVMLNITPGFFLHLFGLTEDFIKTGIPVLRMVSFAIIFQSASVIWLNAVTATGKTFINLLIEITAIVFYGVYVFMVIEKYQLNLVWAWASELIYWFVIILLSVAYIYSGKWKETMFKNPSPF
ncbi:MAG: MATE family efflux transporter [Bacteroidota bacterium]